MSKYPQFEAPRLRDYPLQSRKSKVHTALFARPLREPLGAAFLDSLPDILAGRDFRLLVERILQARRQNKALVWGFGGHVVKVGLAPVLIHLMEQGFVSALATNGSGIIHDFEIALSGQTSEEVEEQIRTGDFGMARETGEFLNDAVCRGAADGKGIGESVGAFLDQADPPYARFSLIWEAYRREIPLTVHVAIGTDVVCNHPRFSGEAWGKASQIDFRILTYQVARLHQGGVYLNLGSAVILPEVFLKAVALVRNSGQPLEGFCTANLDFIQHYRPLKNVVRRPVGDTGTGIALTGHHEIMLPLLAAVLSERA